MSGGMGGTFVFPPEGEAPGWHPNGASDRDPDAPSRTLAGWALGLSFIGCSMITLVLSVVFASMVLVRCRDGRNHGKRLAIAALVLCTAWVVILAAVINRSLVSDADRDAGGQIEAAGDIALGQLRAGDCVVAPTGEMVLTVKGVPCDTPHDSEVYATYPLAGDDFPGNDRADQTALSGCMQRFRDFVGRDYEDSELEILYLPPNSRSWSLGDRTVICLVNASDDVTGSLRNARR